MGYNVQHYVATKPYINTYESLVTSDKSQCHGTTIIENTPLSHRLPPLRLLSRCWDRAASSAVVNLFSFCFVPQYHVSTLKESLLSHRGLAEQV